MKKKLLLIMIIGLPILVLGQKKGRDISKVKLPMKDNSIYYEVIIDSLNAGKDKLYDESLKWMANTFVDSKEVIQIKDKSNGNIVGTGVFDYVAPGLAGGKERMAFMSDITTKDNKVRLRLYQFRYMTFGSAYYGSGRRSADSEYQPFDAKYISYLNELQFPLDSKKYFMIVGERIQSIIDSYVKFIRSGVKSDDF